MNTPIPRQYASADDRCDEACFATQSPQFINGGGPTPNGAIAMLLHMAVDADCSHCASSRQRTRTVENAYHLLALVVDAAKAVGKASA